MTTALTPSCVPVNIYLALLPCLLPLQSHGPRFSMPRICGSLQGSPALLSCRSKHAPGGTTNCLLPFVNRITRKVLARTCPKLLLNKILKISVCYGGWLNQPVNLPEILCWRNVFLQLIRGFMFVLEMPRAKHPRQMAPEQAPHAAGNSG